MEEQLEGQGYRFLRNLNSGSFGQVVLAQRIQTNELVAIKLLKRNQTLARAAEVAKYWQREIVAHSQLNHPFVVRFYEVFLSYNFLAIAMEYVPGGTLLEYLNERRGLAEEEARGFFQQLIVSVDYCHKMGIVNRDIKLENTLLSGGDAQTLKLIDFGYAKTDSHSLPKSVVGTKGYTAPEIVSGRNRTYDARPADVWSCGVILYIMLFYAYPFERKTDAAGSEGMQQVLERILAVDYIVPPAMRHIAPAAQDLLRQIFVADPAKRITIDGIKAHPWFAQDFSPALEKLNDRLLQRKCDKPKPQSLEDISRILHQAAIVGPVFDFETEGSNEDGMYDSGLTEMVSQEMQNYDSYNDV